MEAPRRSVAQGAPTKAGKQVATLQREAREEQA